MDTEKCPQIACGTEPLKSIIDSLLGSPFEPYGRGPRGYYCLGFCLEVIRRGVGIDLEDPFVPHVSDSRFRTFFERFDEIPIDPRGPIAAAAALRPFDVLYSRTRGDGHVSIVESDRWAATVDYESGVVRVELVREIALTQSVHRLKELAR